MAQATLRTLITCCTQHPGLPREAMLKTDLLRLGLAFSPAALEITAKAKAKSYFIFSFDRARQEDLTAAERHSAPEEIALVDGPWKLQRTIVSTRLNPQSPYRVAVGDDASTLQLSCDGEHLCDITLPGKPPYYDENLANGKPVTDIAPTIQWGYLIYLTAFRLCQYWGRDEECQFCDMNENYRQQKQERSYTGIKDPSDICAALAIIDRLDTERTSRAYTVTGGSITSTLQGMGEADFYARYASAIESQFPGRWIGKVVAQALPLAEAKQLKDAGYQIYHPNYEVWDRRLFDTICPGKARYVGRDEWIKRIVDSAEFFGPEHVIPNFVAGVELAKPHGFDTIDAAIQSTAEGLDWFMAQGISPRFTIWCVEPNTVLVESNSAPPPLEYFARLLQVYRDTHAKYGLGVPPGYGPAGVGKAVFSVSAFMDVL